MTSGVQAAERGVRKRHSRQGQRKNPYKRAVLGGAVGAIWGEGVSAGVREHFGLLLKRGWGASDGSGISEGLRGGGSTNQRFQ